MSSGASIVHGLRIGDFERVIIVAWDTNIIAVVANSVPLGKKKKQGDVNIMQSDVIIKEKRRNE